MLDVHALDRPDPLGEVEDLGLGERRRREPAAPALPDHGRVQALLDRRPDRERRREVIPVDDEVRAVAHADLVQLGEELVRRVAREDVREAGLDADADEREETPLGPAVVLRELRVAELDARLLVRPLGMRLRERHRHVEVGAAGLEGGLEDRRVEARVDRVQDRVRVVGAGGRHDRRRVGRVEGDGREARIPGSLRRSSGASLAHVGEDEPLEEVAPLRHRAGRGPDAAGSDQRGFSRGRTYLR